MRRSGKGKNLVETGEMPRSGATETAHNAVTCRRGVSFLFIYVADADRQFARSVKKISDAAAKFPRRTIIISRRILNVGPSVDGQRKNNKPGEEKLFHKLLHI